MNIGLRRALSIAASLCTPFLVQAFLLVMAGRAGPALPDSIAGCAVYISAAAGFVWLALEFGIYAVPFAVLYFPAMVIALVGFSIRFFSPDAF